jgi:transcriptional regulator GlxA family with amidase domain
MGSIGVFNGKFCTTHWSAYEDLEQRLKSTASTSQGQPGRVVKARFVHTGMNEPKIRIITSGGVTCGIDASLHLVKLLVGEQKAIATAEILDYAYRKTEGVVIDDE